MFQDGSVKAILTKSSSEPSVSCIVFSSVTRPDYDSDTPNSFCLSTLERPQLYFIFAISPFLRSSITKKVKYTAISPSTNSSSTASFSTISNLLTLFSKFFSSFLHSTCSLSVSHRYLALEEVYLPFWAAFPNYPTLRPLTYAGSLPTTGLSPCLASCSKELMQ